MPHAPLNVKPALLVEMSAAEIPRVYGRFADAVGEENWTRRAEQVAASVKGNPFLAEFLHHENAIALALDQCGRHLHTGGVLPDNVESNRVLYPAISFAAQVLSMMGSTTTVEADRLCRRVRGAIQDPDAMRAYRLELRAATHLVRRGHDVRWPELTGEGTFDLLVPDLGNNGLELECKSISQDNGRRVGRQHVLTFNHLLYKRAKPVWSNLRTGLSVVVTVPARFPSQRRSQDVLVAQIAQQIFLAQDTTLPDGTTIRIKEFDPSLFNGAQNDPALARRAVEQVTGASNRQAMVVGSPDGRGVLLALIQSAQDDEFLVRTFNTLADAAKRQLTRSRAGILLAGFQGMTPQQLLSAAQQDAAVDQPPTSLAIHVSEFLSATHRDWVVGTVFLSETDVLAPDHPALAESAGAAYYFPKKTTSFWNENLHGMFPNIVRGTSGPLPGGE